MPGASRFRSIVFGTAVMLAGAAGCTMLPARSPITPVNAGPMAVELAQREAQWVAAGVRTYRLDVSYLCECSGGDFRIVVVDGRVNAVVHDGRPVNVAEMPGFPTTIDAMFVAARDAIAGGGSITATYDGRTGVPIKLLLDYIPNGIDDEISIEIRNFAPGLAS